MASAPVLTRRCGGCTAAPAPTYAPAPEAQGRIAGYSPRGPSPGTGARAQGQILIPDAIPLPGALRLLLADALLEAGDLLIGPVSDRGEIVAAYGGRSEPPTHRPP